MENNRNKYLTYKQVFISYASVDRDRVILIMQALESEGIKVWLDQNSILGGDCYGPGIVSGIRDSGALLLMCSDASLRSKNVNAEIRLAWKYDVPIVPLLLEPVNYPEQVEFWLEGNQWIEIYGNPQEKWLPSIIRSIEHISFGRKGTMTADLHIEKPPFLLRQKHSLQGLRNCAKFTDQIWPVKADALPCGVYQGTTRGLGAPQPSVSHGFQLGSHIRIVIESHHSGHLLLLDEGPEGKIYCLCPSVFAPVTDLGVGRTVLPHPDSPYDSFYLSGIPGREELLAIVTKEPIQLDWMTMDPNVPARELTNEDIDVLTEFLKNLEADQWSAYATYFDVNLY